MEEPKKSRYSDEELAEFKALIEKKLAAAREELDFYVKLCQNDGNETTDTSPAFLGMEDGSLSAQKEANAQQADKLVKFIKSLEGALVRIANKTYGICCVTGKLIPKERLMCVPNTTMSIEGKMATKK